MIAEYLSAAIHDREQTLYATYCVSPQLTTLKFAITCQCSGTGMDPAYQIRYSSDAQYAANISSMFSEAVSCRLRSCGPVSAEMSGGVDSLVYCRFCSGALP